ncbi:unnamed protein product [Leptidea sinapis]|uniref:Fucosyltransferase n=1 Tax=Leptidea sinapis TaxID=189913 RepID=A0A5E4PYF7_9NEOP|nr:unnamed protein product [Leptidea sinapis]
MLIICLNFKREDNPTHAVPLLVWWTSSFPGTTQIRYCLNNVKCNVVSDHENINVSEVDAFLFYGSNLDFDNLPLPRRPTDVIWGLYHEESPRNVEELMHLELLELFNYSSTFSEHSDVPFPLQYLDSFDDITNSKYFVPTTIKNGFKNISAVMYLQTDCETATERDEYVKELMKYIQVDSYGTCLKNKDMPTRFTMDYLNNLNDDSFLRFIARYKFVLAIENGVCDDYVTEKFWRAIKTGTVPIYFGSPTIRHWLPNEKSAILLEDYPSPKVMSEHIKKLVDNDSLYETYLEHKTQKLISNKKLLDEFRLRPYQLDALEVVKKFECLICEKVHDKRSGIIETKMVNNYHYNCPKPVSALTLQVNPSNNWVFSWYDSKLRAKEINKRVMNKI